MPPAPFTCSIHRCKPLIWRVASTLNLPVLEAVNPMVTVLAAPVAAGGVVLSAALAAGGAVFSPAVAPGETVKKARITLRESTNAKPTPKRFMVPPCFVWGHG